MVYLLERIGKTLTAVQVIVHYICKGHTSKGNIQGNESQKPS